MRNHYHDDRCKADNVSYAAAYQGFTLVEIAIVLVIVGVIVGATLKGREIITNAKVKRLYAQSQELRAAVYGYQDKYGYLPGDDPKTEYHAGFASSQRGNGDGDIDIASSVYCPDTTSGGEACEAWDHLRQGGFISGSRRQSPKHPFGAHIGLINGANGSSGAPALWTQNTTVACFQNIEADIAAQIETTFDDGNYQTGAIRGNANYMTGAIPAYFCIVL